MIHDFMKNQSREKVGAELKKSLIWMMSRLHAFGSIHQLGKTRRAAVTQPNTLGFTAASKAFTEFH